MVGGEGGSLLGGMSKFLASGVGLLNLPQKGKPCSWYETTFDTTVACNRISVQDRVLKNVASHYFAVETKVRDIGIEQMLKKIYTAEFT